VREGVETCKESSLSLTLRHRLIVKNHLQGTISGLHLPYGSQNIQNVKPGRTDPGLDSTS
jgi:hypothetical protein